jgi:intraflagellar transport protein 74
MATSRDLESVQDMPTVDNWKQMQTDLAYKERQMQDAQATMQKLQAEVMQRRREFEDLRNVDQKIEDEIQQSKEKMQEMEAEMPKFGDVDAVREDGEARKRLKAQERDQLKGQFESLRKVTNALATRFNEAKAAFRADEIGRKLAQLEKEIRTQASENNTTAESIEDNRRRTNYTLVKRQALAIVAEINAML